MNVVCYSGGHSSALVAIEAVRKHGKEKVILLNHDISLEVENEDIKRFKRDVADYLDLPITYANANDWENLTPLEVCRRKGAIVNPHTRQALCTHVLKTEPFDRWLADNYPASFNNPCKDATFLYGFDFAEVARIQRRSSVMGAKGYKTDYPLAFWERTIENTEDVGILRPKTYRVFKHANCFGCLKAGIQHWYIVYCLRPELFADAVQMEQEVGYNIVGEDSPLDSLIPRYEEMKSVGVCPNDIENNATFWAKVNRMLGGQINMLPCDCAF